jgi:hypothetical protein
MNAKQVEIILGMLPEDSNVDCVAGMAGSGTCYAVLAPQPWYDKITPVPTTATTSNRYRVGYSGGPKAEK